MRGYEKLSSRSVKGITERYTSTRKMYKKVSYIFILKKKKTVHSKPFKGIQSVGVDFLRDSQFSTEKERRKGIPFHSKIIDQKVMALSS